MTSSPTPSSRKKVTVIQPHRGWVAIDWNELLGYRDLLYFMLRRDIKARYAQSILGFGWAIIRPVLSMIIFSVVFGRLAKIDGDGLPYPLFSYVGLVPWTYFAAAVSSSTGSLVGNPLLAKVYFPRLIIPLSPVFSNLVDFGIACLLIAPLMIYYGYSPPITILFLPLLVLLMVITAAGIGIWLSALAVQYRDVRFASSFFVSLLMYAAPVAWPASEVPNQFRWLYGLYPMAGVIEGFRALVISANPIPVDLLLSGSLSAIFIFLSGTVYFSHREHMYADVS